MTLNQVYCGWTRWSGSVSVKQRAGGAPSALNCTMFSITHKIIISCKKRTHVSAQTSDEGVHSEPLFSAGPAPGSVYWKKNPLFSPSRSFVLPSAHERRDGASTVAGSAKLLGANGAFGPTAPPCGTRRDGDGSSERQD